METSLWFLQELELYKTVKPYRLDFDPEDDDFPRTNVSRVEKHGITVHDIREYQNRLRFHECGFTILLMPQSLVTLNYDDIHLVKSKYYSYIETVVQQHSEQYRKGARVIALDHKVRKRDTAFLVSHGKNYPDPQPVMVAHIDWTPHTIEKKLRIVVGDEKTDEILTGLWARHTPEKESRQCSWLKLLVASTDHDTRVFIFKYDIEPKEDRSIWHQLLGLSKSLLDSLRQSRPFESQRRPLYFICHNLGGIVVKQALYLAQRDYPAINNALSGVVFLSTPHLTTVDDERWGLWPLILRHFRGEIPKNVLRRQDVEILANVCERFSSLNLEVRLLSVFETKPTKVKDAGPLKRFRGSGKMLVDRAHATISATGEELFGVNLSHSELTFVDFGTPLFNRLVEYLRSAPSEGWAIVHNAFERLEIDVGVSDTHSRTSHPAETVEGMGEVDQLQPTPQLTRVMRPTEYAPRQRQVLLPCYSLGQNRNRNFFGQENTLGLIDKALLPDLPPETSNQDVSTLPPHDPKEINTPSSEPTGVAAFAVCGMGGLGKTEIAIEYIHSRKHHFDAIFWVNSADLQKIDASFKDMALKLGLQDEMETLNEPPAATRDLVKGWLANPVRTLGIEYTDQASDVRWLIVFDNADHPDLLYDYWPTGTAGSILITSRNPVAKQLSLTGCTGIDLPHMPIRDAGHLLQKSSQREKEADSLKTCSIIAERLGGLPLAIMQMAHLIRAKHLSLVEFIEYNDYDAKMFQESPVLGLIKQQTLASIWNIDSLPKPAVALLRVLSVLDGDVLYEDILLNGAQKVKLEGYPQDKVSYFQARETLINSSLVTRNIDLGFLKIHRIVQEVVRQKLVLEDYRAVYNAAVVLVTAVWPFVDDTNLNKSERLRKVQRYFPQVAMLRSVLEEKKPEVLKPQISIAALFNEASWTYILQAWDFNLQRGAEYANLSQTVLEIGRDDANENDYTKLLANSYRFQGITGTYMDSEVAVPSCKKWISLLVERIEKYQESSDINTLPIAYNELGMALMRIPDQEEAVKSWVMSCETIPQVTKPGELPFPFPFPWVHRAIVSAYSGDPDAGYDLLLPVLQEREKKLGVDDTSTIETGFILSFLGNIRRIQGREDDAFSYHKRGATALKTTTGERSAFAIQALYRLARDHFDRESYNEAKSELRKCLDFAGDIPWYQAEAARSAWKLGRTLKASGENENEKESRSLLKKAMHLRKELDPKDEREEPELVDDDWDRLVYYFYR